MWLENKIENEKNIQNVKELLKNKDINWALFSLEEISKNNIENKKEELEWNFRLAEFTSQLNEVQTKALDDILKQFLIPQNIK